MSNTKHYIWAAIGKFGVEILSFIGNVLIARILMPDDYGLVAMLSIFISLATTLSDSGFNDYLIRKQNCDKIDIGTIATYNMVIALILYTVMFVSSPHLAHFFHRNELETITKVLAIGFVLKAFTLSGFVQLNKSLQFKKISLINISCSILSIIGTYIIALCGMGYWALVLQPLIIAISNILLLLVFAQWKPYFCFNWNRFKNMFSFSSNLLISYLITTIANNIYGFIIGKFYTATQLGYYNQAHKMQSIPTQGINNVILTTSYPLIAQETDPVKRYYMYVSLFKKFNAIIIFFTFALISISDSVFCVIFGEKWMPSSNLFQIFMIIAITYPIMTINSNIAKISGRADIYRNLSFIRSGCQLIALLLCAPFGLKMIIIGQVIAAFISIICDMYFAGRLNNFPFHLQCQIWFHLIWKPLLAFIISKFISLIFQDMMVSSIIWTSSYIIIYILICEFSNDPTYYIFKTKLRHAINKLTIKI